jgi:phenylacetate-coenzyme A ligase PaaK-like adenylate-forming protein/spore maturation protein CgeB
MDRAFHEGRRWTSICTPRLIEGILSRFECRILQNQGDYERELDDLEAVLSLEPLWGAPMIEFGRTPALREKFRSIPSYVINSDPHDKLWRQSYFLGNEIDFFLTYYYYPTLYHMRRLPPERLVLLPWAVPDEFIGNEEIVYRGGEKLSCFGAAQHEAYVVRNWCRGFPFVESTSNSGVENAVMSNEEYMRWLASKDAAIAAGSEDPKYRLTVPKYYEIAAAGALLFAQETDDLAFLGFRHMENCIVFTRNNFEQLAREYLAEPADYLDIRRAGRELIRRRHSLSARLDSFELHVRQAVAEKERGTSAASVVLLAPSPDEPERVPSGSHDVDREFEAWFSRICVPEVLCEAKLRPLALDGKALSWEVCHEILAYHRFSSGAHKPEELVDLSNRRYELLDRIWPGAKPTREQLDRFYTESAKVLPWGHGVFMANHELAERRQNWMRRVELLEQLRSQGVRSLLDFGAGGGHTSLLAKAMGFERVVHHEYPVFHPYVAWRAGRIAGKEFALSDASRPLSLDQPVDAVICADVAEHVHDPERMLDEIAGALKPGGYLVWVACFEPTIAGHLHAELRGKEEELLARHGFERLEDLAAEYQGHTGLYRLKTAGPVSTNNLPHNKLPSIKTTGDPTRDTLRAHLESTQWLARPEIERMQMERLRRLLNHAWRNVPFYRKRMEQARLKPDDVRSMEDFRRLPVLTKADIQAHLSELKAANFSDSEMIQDATGGSTGNPISFHRDHTACLWVEELAARFRRWIGYEHGDKLALIWGADRDVPDSHPPHERWLNSFNCSDDDVRRFLDEVREWRPKAIRAYASSMAMVAGFAKRHGLTLPSPDGIECSAEKLHVDQRRLIEEIFHSPVFDMYGSREIPALACECERHDGLHVFADARIVEIICDGRLAQPGEEGRIVVTDLVNYGMPFIRYEIGDVGRLSDKACACGRGLPLLQEVTGRVTSTITTPDGRRIHGEFFTHLFYNLNAVKAFQVRQRALDRIDVAVQPDKGLDSKDVEKIVERIREHVGPNVSVAWRTVQDIPPAPSGKRHFTISDVPAFAGVQPPSPTRRKPRVLVIVDAPNWAHDIKTRCLIKHLGADYDFVKRYQGQVSEADLDDADLIMVYYWLQLGSMLHLNAAFERNRRKLLMGICSHVELEGQNRERGLAELRRLARAVFLNSRLLEEEFRPLLDKPVYYTPNGVETEFFTPGESRPDGSPLRVGWAGSLGNMNPEVRGYHEFIVPACSRVEGVELASAIREEKWRGPKEMREFYRSLDVYLCASRKEGTPNPCLEAAACGVPLLTTRVGNMPELVRDGENGLFIERDVADIVAKLTKLRDDAGMRGRMAESVLTSIQKWDWSKQAENYRAMFEAILGESDGDDPERTDEIPAEVAEAIQAGTAAVAREDWDAAVLAFAGALAAAPELPGLADALKNVQRLRARLSGEHAEEPRPARKTTRRDGMSFCVITGGTRPEKLRLTIEGIHRQNIPDSEIIVVGNHHEEEDILYIPAVEAARQGRLGEMRNLAVERAQFNRIVILDDDILLGAGWYDAMKARGEDWDILTSRILLPDGTRYWDYATVGGPRGHRLLRHDESADDFVYMSGGTAWVMKDHVAESVRWEAHLGFYEDEDVRFSRRCVEQGFHIEHNPNAVAYHYDPSYTRVGRSILRRSEGLDNLWLVERPELMDAEALFGLIKEKAMASAAADLADCLRAGMQLYPNDDRFPKVWAPLDNQFNGDAGGDHWSLNGDPSMKALLAELTPMALMTP